MKKLTRKIAAFLAVVLMFTSMAEYGGGIAVKAAEKGFTVTFKGTDGKIVSKQSVEPGGNITSVPDLPKDVTSADSKTVYYWTPDSGRSMYKENEVAELTINKNYDFTVDHKTIATRTVGFYYGDNLIKTVKVEDGTCIPQNDIPDRTKISGAPSTDAADFSGWYETINATDDDVTPSYKLYNGKTIYSDTNYYALFTYKVKFHLSDSREHTYTIQSGRNLKKTVLPDDYYDEKTTSGDGMGVSIGNKREFLGWYNEPTGGTQYGDKNGSFDMEFEKNQTKLYPHWSNPSAGSYKVTFEVNGLSGATEDIEVDGVATNAVILKFPQVSKPGHKLVKWIGSDGREYFSKEDQGSNATKITGDVVLTPEFEINKHVVQFNYRKQNENIPESELNSTDLSTIFLEERKTLNSVEYDSLIPESEIPDDVANVMKLDFLAPSSENSEELIQYTVTCTYNNKWKAGGREWNFSEDKVSSDMIMAEGEGDSSLHPDYDISYYPHTPPKDYQYDENTIFDTKECNVTFTYTAKGGSEAKDSAKVKYGRTIPEAFYPNDKVLETMTSTFYDRIAEGSQDYIEFTATYTFTGSWYKDGTGVIWNHDRFVTEDNLNLIPVYSVTFSPFTPWSFSGGQWGEDTGGSIDKIEEKYSQVTFDHNNGSNKTTKISVPKNQPMDPDIAPKVKKSGMKFAGWAKDKDGTVMYDWSESPIEANLVLYAVWVEQVDIVYNSEGGSYISVETIALGQTAPRIEDPVKKGYTFIGWSRTRQKTRPSTDYKKYAYDFTKPVTKKDVTLGQMKLYAWYKPNAKVRFYYNTSPQDKNYHEVSLEEGKDGSFVYPDYEPEPENTPENMIFKGWYTERSGGNQITKNNFNPSRDTTSEYYAHWVKGFKITYVLDISSNEQKVVSYEEGTSPVPPDVEQRDGKSVTGWYLDEELKEEALFSEIQKDTTVYAKWEQIKLGGNVTITLDANGGTFKGSAEKITVTAKKGENPNQSKLAAPAYPDDGDMVFIGWCLDKDCVKDVNFNNVLEKDVTYYAKWGYEVSFDLGGKADVEGIPNQYIGNGKKLTEPQNIKSSKYALIGWSTQKTPTEEQFWNFDKDVITGKTRLYAIWGVSIIFDANGGYFTDPQWGKVKTMEVNIGEADYAEKVLNMKPEYPGRSFAGWYKDEFGTEIFNFGDGSLRAYAKWEDLGIEYKIAVDGGNASVAAAKEDKRVAVIARVPEGKLFVRWETEDVTLKNAENSITTFSMPARDVTITAVYKDDPNAKKPDIEEEPKPQPQPSPEPQPDSDKGGGSGSGGGTSGDDELADNNKPASENKIIAVTSTVKSGPVSFSISESRVSAAIEAALLQEAVEEAENVKNPQASVVFDIKTNKNVNKVTVKLTEKSIQKLAQADIDILELRDKYTTLRMDNMALEEISSNTKGEVSFVIGKSTQKLSKTVKKAVGKRPVITVKIQYKKKTGNKNKTVSLSKLNKGKMEVQLPYTASKSEKKGGTKYLYGVYVDAKGKAYYVKNSTYDAKNKTLKFKINQFNTYSIAYKKSK